MPAIAGLTIKFMLIDNIAFVNLTARRIFQSGELLKYKLFLIRFWCRLSSIIVEIEPVGSIVVEPEVFPELLSVPRSKLFLSHDFLRSNVTP